MRVAKFLLLLVALGSATASAAYGSAEVSHFTLANGLEVVVVPIIARRLSRI